MKKVNVKICELIKYTINFYKNLGKMESIFNQYGITMNEELNTQYEPLTEQKAQEISQKDKENMQIYKNRNVENMKKICEIHKSLSSAEREYLENLELIYYNNVNDKIIYDEATYNEVCQKIK